MNDNAIQPQIDKLALKSGDTVIVNFGADLPNEAAKRVLEYVRGQIPDGVGVLLVVPPVQIAGFAHKDLLTRMAKAAVNKAAELRPEDGRAWDSLETEADRDFARGVMQAVLDVLVRGAA